MPDRQTSIPAQFFAPDGKNLSPLAYAFLVLLCVAFFIPGIVSLPPTDRDESSFAQASKQMIETGNYVDIRLQDKPRYKKPIGIYWLQAASVKLFNAAHLNEIWAYRIPSFVGATVAVVMTAALGSLLFGPLPGFLAAMMMAGCVLLNVEARLAKTDAALLGSIMVAQYALARAYLNIRMNGRVSLAFWTALSVGILLKGPIILLVVLSTLLWLRFTNKNLKWFMALKPLAGIPYLLLLVAPWFIAILLQSHGAFLEQSAGQDMFAKLWQGQNRGMLPPGLHLVALSVMFFPFALFVLLATPDAWENRHRPAVCFCLGWIIPTWIVFELSLTKLPHYVLPTYPAIAILTAKFLLDGFPALAEKPRRWMWMSGIALWLLVGTGIAVAFALLPYLSDHVWNFGQIAASALLILAQGAALFLLMQRKTDSALALVIGSLMFMSFVFGSTLPRLQHLWISRQAVQIAETIKPCDRLQIVSASYEEPSLVFLAGTDTVIAHDGADAATAMQHNGCLVGLIDSKRQQSFLTAFPKRARQPMMIGKAEGLNIGQGHPTELAVYIMQPPAKHP